MGASVEKLPRLKKVIFGAPYSGDGKVGVSSRMPLLEPPTLTFPEYGVPEMTFVTFWGSLTGIPMTTGRLSVRVWKRAKSAPRRTPVPQGKVGSLTQPYLGSCPGRRPYLLSSEYGASEMAFLKFRSSLTGSPMSTGLLNVIILTSGKYGTFR